MRDAISRLMLTVDEAWLAHSNRLRTRCTVTPADIRVEDALFRIEASLKRAERNIAPKPRTKAPLLLPPSRGPQARRSQPH